MTDSHRTSASTSNPTLVDDGTPAGNPTPAGEPTAPTNVSSSSTITPMNVVSPAEAVCDDAQADLFPGRTSAPEAEAAPDPETLQEIGQLVLAWGRLEHTIAEKLAMMRKSFGDVRAVGGRSRPTMPKLLAELRALVAMRDRHDKQVLTTIVEIDSMLQRTAQVRQLVLEGAQAFAGAQVICYDLKNMPHTVGPDDLARETAQLDRIRSQIAAL